MLPENKSQLYAYRWLEYSSLTSLAIRQQRGLYTIAQMAEILVGIAVFSVGFEMLLAAQWRQGNGGARTKRGSHLQHGRLGKASRQSAYSGG